MPPLNRDPITTLVIPCYDEANRLNAAAFTGFVTSRPDVRLVLVNDGSRDGTLAVLEAIRSAAADRVEVLDLDRNYGKAEAVRRGMNHALAAGAEFVGYWDADLATPLDALSSFLELLREHPSLEIVIGSRVLLLGRTIERRAMRHYAGRVFATAASVTLGIPVYDTQCGAKVFRASARLARVLETPFLSSWVFDVEIIARFGVLPSGYAPEELLACIYELPLRTWRHVPGSKVRPFDFARALLDLVRIHNAYIRRGGRSR